MSTLVPDGGDVEDYVPADIAAMWDRPDVEQVIAEHDPPTWAAVRALLREKGTA